MPYQYVLMKMDDRRKKLQRLLDKLAEVTMQHTKSLNLRGSKTEIDERAEQIKQLISRIEEEKNVGQRRPTDR
mgnify:CR=1 FL=1